VQAAHEWARTLQQTKEKERIRRNLCGACAITSAWLWRRLHNAGIDATIVIGQGHVFLMVGRWYVDATATQFGKKPVLVMSRRPKLAYKRYDSPWEARWTAESLDELMERMEEEGWYWDAERIVEYVLEAA
jgi:hypothetical protein